MTTENKMFKKEKKEFLTKVTIGVGKLLCKPLDYTGREISEITGISTTRLTEYKDFNKYNRVITETHLAVLLGEGIITMEALMGEVGKTLTEKESAALKKYEIYEDKAFKKTLFDALQKGIDVVEVLRQASLVFESGSNPIDVLKEKI